jgi:serine/threonine-protein kinase
VVHRDIKPENILLQHGSALVADFGIALAVQQAGSGRMTQTGMSLGTPQYMSPEQAMGEKNIDARADVYALGAVTYEMLVGEPPFTGPSVQAIVAKVMSEAPKEVSAQRKTVPNNVSAAVSHALQKLPADRFTSAAAFAEALANPSFVGAATAAGVARGAAAERRGGTPWMRVAVGIALLAIGAAVGAVMMYRAPSPSQVVRFTMQLPAGQRLMGANRFDTPFVLSPGGTRIAYVAFDSGATQPTLHERALDQLTGSSLPGTYYAVNPFFSPDGLWIGFVNTRGEIFKVPTAGGPVSPIATDARVDAAPSWGDDHTILFTKFGGRLARVRDGGGAVEIVADSANSAGYAAPQILPGSRAALLTVCAFSGANCAGLEVLDLASKKLKMLVPQASRGWYLPSGHLVYGTSQGALFAAKFDLKTLALTSAPVSVLDGVGLGARAITRAVFSSSGTMAYASASSTALSEIVQVDRAGRETPLRPKPGTFELPRYSPDGGRLAMMGPDGKSAQQIWIHDRAAATTRQLTFDGESFRPAWSPDGARVAFSSTRDGKNRIWWAPADGSSPGEAAGEKLELTSAASISWTRDGSFLVWDGQIVGKKGAGEDDIFAVPVTGTDRSPRIVVATPSVDETGEVSPDGKWIAYVSSDGEKSQVYIQPFLAPGGRTLISAGRAQEPAWASNNELVFLNTENDSLTSARLEFGPIVKVTRTSLFSRQQYTMGSRSIRNYDVSRDGKSFVFVKPTVQSASAMPIVVINWIDEVKRLMNSAGIK